MTKKNPSVDGYIRKNKRWQAELEQLRRIALECGLAEEVKWRNPCYTLQGKNIVLIHLFNDYCAYLFFKGALLSDPAGILIQQTENTQAARQIRFTHVDEIVEMEPLVKAAIREAIAVEKAGLKVPLKETAEFPMPEEFQAILDENPLLKTAFEALTPGRQRGYLLYFSAPKQAKTRASRVEKCIPQIIEGRGLYDR